MICSIDTLLEDSISRLCQADATFELKPRYESELLLSFLLGVPRTYLHTHSTQNIESALVQRFYTLINERAKGKPIEYITHQANFYGRSFYVDERVLIPRPETEILIDKADEIIKKQKLDSIAEVGIGSGIITTTLALLHPQCQFFATDISEQAIEVSKRNITTYVPNANITLQCCSLLPSHITPQLIISNPPYIKDDYPISTPLRYEPKIALFAGKDGLETLKSLINECATRQVWLLCEMGYDQKAALEHILEQNGAKHICFYKDLSGWDRAFSAYFGA
ncbi:peptide chain release factor N(5)-glutamine methyltransferase [Helicobacter sp. MIT 21-1697]|uniref:peptide chain release factor N(5)-glutamine methyltransferase n=1 Tax=Helicobacter sp. MIT 21-1697 TaxID=2993733 RepID=UPI00224AA201|nr:peptide chain release factor N(5)-glutamine methyltransferase [Helicobacter sp. MIT 21-1697]MCX2717869.1 peptide chain release factor N(5)-glutamine methyltransferase [Helicobacter sp. MIT 21-1697]